MVKDCTCGDAGTCTRCVLESYEPTPEEAHVMWAHDMLKDALARPANVTPLQFWSVKV